MLGLWFPPRQDHQQFRSKMLLPPNQSVLMLGGGASVCAGGPLMKDFIDRARDYRTQGLFKGQELDDVTSALRLYDQLRASFSITEEDIENVENILSLADLSRRISGPPIP